MQRRTTLARLLVALVTMVALWIVAAMPASAQGGSPQQECADLGLEYVDKIDEINGSGDYTSDEGFDYTVTVTDNPNPTQDDYTVEPDPATSGNYPDFTNITEAPKFGEGGGLSHITICGETGTDDGDDTADDGDDTADDGTDDTTDDGDDTADDGTDDTTDDGTDDTADDGTDDTSDTADDSGDDGEVKELPTTGSGADDNGTGGFELLVLVGAGVAVVGGFVWNHKHSRAA